jgi:hypothetical protein
VAQDTTQKKTNYLTQCVANAQMLEAARNEAKRLAELLSSDATIAGIVDADCVGANSHLTRAIINNYLQNGIQADLERMLTNGSVATVNRLPNLLAMLNT